MVELIPKWRLLGLYSHDFINPIIPLEPVAIIQLVIKYCKLYQHSETRPTIVGTGRKSNLVKPIYWLSVHPMPSLPFIEACEILGETNFPRSIKYINYCHSENSHKSVQRVRIERIFAKIMQIGKTHKALIVLDDMTSLFTEGTDGRSDENISAYHFMSTLFALVNRYDIDVVYTKSATPSDFVDQQGDRLIFSSWIRQMEKIANQLKISHQQHWLCRPPPSALF